MTRRRLTALALALCAALPALFNADTARAEDAPAPNLTSTTRDLGNGYGQTVWWDAAGDAYDLGLVFRLPAPKAVPGIAIPVVYAGGGVEGMIRSAAARHGVDGERLVRIARCESGLNPGAYNRRSGASGVMQFIPSTWRATPQGRAGADVFDAAANVEAGAWLMRNYGPGQWECRG
jgi:soluble lytic murein transglycosylase-like protein